MNIGNEIKKIAVDNGVTLTHLAKIIAEKKGKNYTVQNLSTKLRKGTANFNELDIMLNEMGYEIIFNKIER
jgi:predicted transcriptional regulator